MIFLISPSRVWVPPGIRRVGEALSRVEPAWAVHPCHLRRTETGITAERGFDFRRNEWAIPGPDEPVRYVAYLNHSSRHAVPPGDFDIVRSELGLPWTDDRTSFNRFALRVLSALRAIGVRVNYSAHISAIDDKVTLELRLRAHEAATGEALPRPATKIVGPRDAGRGLPDLGVSTGKDVLFKPAGGTRGLGIRVLPPGGVVPAPCGRAVVQDLLSGPMLHDGHKVDFRAYALVADGGPPAVCVSEFVLMRAASSVFRPGDPDSEICNTSATRRRGLPPRVWDLRSLVSDEQFGQAYEHVRDVVRRATTALARRSEIPGAFLGLFAFDLVVTSSAGRLQPWLLEANTLPQLYRGDPRCDAAIDEVLKRELHPFLDTLERRHFREAMTGTGKTPLSQPEGSHDVS